MAITIPIITEFADKGIVAAQSSFATFKGKVAEAEGGMGKFKAGAGVALDTVKANAGVFAAAAGGAIAGFALNAIKDFQDLALSVDEFRNKTDLTLDQSSKWVSYTGDLGIEADAMTKIFSRLAKAATDEIPAFEELGVAIAFGPDGSTDIEETFLRVNDAINALDDPVAEAAYRADLFGKGWMTASELVVQGSDDIRTALDGVKDFEVIDEKEIEKAKDLRQAQDELGDAFQEISVKIGTVLIPALSGFLGALTPIVNLLGDVDYEMAQQAGSNGAIENYVKAWDNLKEGPIKFLTGSLGFEFLSGLIGDNSDELNDNQLTVDELHDAWVEGYRAMIDASEATEDLTEDLITVDDALMELKGNVDDRREWDNLIGAIEDAKEAAIDAFFKATPEALRESQRETDEARVKVAEYIAQMDEIPEEKKTEMIAALDQANLAEIEAQFNYLARAREIPFMPVVRPGTGGINEIGSGGRPIGEAPFGYRLPSLSGVGMRSGVTVNVAGSVISQNDLVETVRKGLVNSQRNGAGLVYSNR